jgi:hypothetical protein
LLKKKDSETDSYLPAFHLQDYSKERQGRNWGQL